MYDGMCTLTTVPPWFPKLLNRYGIKCRVFAPIRPFLTTSQNHRDHRKILVIDGETAYTGGINLADEYVNVRERFGHWKDTAIMLKGEAVKSFTMMFLQNWNLFEGENEYKKFIFKSNDYIKDGYVMPFGDSPYDNELVSETVYLHIINHAKKYIHIMTPYLILDNEMYKALEYAAKRGVDVKIICPHIADKPSAYMIARTYYEKLIEKGIKIYEYTPGFIHAKVFVSDDYKAVVGTINLDFRSLYLNFECGVYLQDASIIKVIENDYQKTLNMSEEITLGNCRNYSKIKLLIGKFLWVFGPLM
jgi:cardiolipin synthase